MHAEPCAANDLKSRHMYLRVKMYGLLAGICLLQVMLASSNMLLAVNSHTSLACLLSQS